MITFFTIIHVLLCVFMVFVILLQPGKDAGMGAALGGGAATSAFGGRGAVTFLSKVTAICAGLFFLTSLGLSFVGLRESVADRVAPAAAAPATTPPAAGAEGAKTEDGKEGAAAPAQGIEQPAGTTTSAPVTTTPAAPAPAPGAPAPAAPAPAPAPAPTPQK